MYEFDVAPAEHDVVEFVGEARDCDLEIKSIDSAILFEDSLFCDSRITSYFFICYLSCFK